MFDNGTRSANLQQIAIVGATGSITRQDLGAAVTSMAARLERLGVGAGSVVAVNATSEIRTVVALLGARARGALVCPIDPARWDAITEVLRPDVRIVGAAEGAETVDIEVQQIERPAEVHAQIADGWGISTSGSTGRSKTVVLAEASAMRIAEWSHLNLDYRETDRVYSPLPLHHILGLSQIWICLRAGASLVFPSPNLPASEFVSWLRDATVLPAVPVFLRRLVNAVDKPKLRVVTLGGQVTLPEDRVRFARAFPQTAFHTIYGMTESLRSIWLHPDEFLSRPEAAGRVTQGMSAWLDDDGELWLSGPHVASCYLGDLELSAERFPKPATVRTGDLFRLDGDVFTYVGRKDSVFKSFGEKVVPEEVERELDRHDKVEKCIVLSEFVGSELRPVAYVIPSAASKAGVALSGNELRDYLKDRVSAAMIPAKFHFVDDLPRSAAGKILRRPPPVR